MMDVSIIIVNYCTPYLTIDCINSIIHHTIGLNYEIIVVDNNSNDDSKHIITKKLRGKIVYIQSDKNLGFGKANNLGCKYATGEYLFLLNSDTLLINNAIKELYEYIKNHKDVGIVGGNLYTKNLEPNASYAMKFNDLNTIKDESRWFNIFKQILSNRITVSKKRKDFNYSNKPKRVAYIYGADLMISRQLFCELKGFDDDFFMYYEEQELSFRVSRLGYQIISVPSARIIHYDGASTKVNDEFKPKQFCMRVHGAFIYFNKCYGSDGYKKYYHYKMKKNKRILKIAKKLKRKKLFELTNIQINCLENIYQNFCEKGESS